MYDIFNPCQKSHFGKNVALVKKKSDLVKSITNAVFRPVTENEQATHFARFSAGKSTCLELGTAMRVPLKKNLPQRLPRQLGPKSTTLTVKK